MIKYERIPEIISADVFGKSLFVLFDNGDIKKLDIDYLHKFGVNLSEKDFSRISFTPHSVIWKNLNYEIGHDSIYDLGQSVNLSPVSVVLLRKARKLSRRKLAQELNVQESEIQALETGKKTNIKLLQKIFSTLSHTEKSKL